jgi:hypothetical protein
LGDKDANHYHLEALVGGRTRWHEHIEQDTKVLGIQWDKLPLGFRQQWWEATGFHPGTEFKRHPPSQQDRGHQIIVRG